MLRFVARRLVLLVVTLFAVACLVFAITRLLPGDVATMILGMSATQEDLETLRESLGLNDPVILQFTSWLMNLLQGDFGTSSRFNIPVAEVIADPLTKSAILALAGITFAVPIGIGFGILTALKKNSLTDRVISSTSLFAAAMPEFVTGTCFLVIFSSWLGWLPAFASSAGEQTIAQQASELVLPVLSLSLVIVAYILRMTRSSVIDALNSDFVRTARLKGLSRSRIMLHHVMPVSLGPTLQVIALSVGWTLSGLVVVESLFGISGIGRLLVFAIQNRDIPLLQTIVLIVATCYAVANLLADIGHRQLDPRVAS